MKGETIKNSKLLATAVQAQMAPKMKMTTEIPPQITTPDSVETRLGTLKFFDGFPDDQTVEKVMDNARLFAGRADVSERLGILSWADFAQSISEAERLARPKISIFWG